MRHNTLAVKLVGAKEDDGLVGLDALAGFCRALSKCLRRVDEAVRPEGDRLRYRVVEMKAASAELTLEAVYPNAGKNDGETVFELFRNTATRLQTGKAPDKRLGFDDIETFRDLLSPLSHHVSEIWIEDFRLTCKCMAGIDRVLGSAIPSRGEVSGCLERLNLHDRYEFVLFPAAGSRIVCTFSESLLDQVREGIKRSVTVSGTLYFQPDKPLPDRVRVEKMEIHPPNNLLPRLRDLKGISPRCTGKMNAVEFVRSLRDE